MLEKFLPRIQFDSYEDFKNILPYDVFINSPLKYYKIPVEKGEITFEDILFNMKYRNASKNEEHYDAYNVRNRPFVVALKIMDMYKKKGYNNGKE